MKALLLPILLVATTSSAMAQSYTVHVFTKTDAAGFIDEESKGRTNSVADMRKALEDKDIRKLFTMVDSMEKADVVLEVLWRGAMETDKTSTQHTTDMWTGKTRESESTPIHQDNLKVLVTVGSYTKEFWALEPGQTNWMGDVPQRTWRKQAELVVKRIADWVRQNHQPITHALAAAAR